jgi:hypothetical protein
MRRIRFTHKRNRGVWGLAFPEDMRIEIDPALDDFTHLDIVCHEALHCLYPKDGEAKINSNGTMLASLLWRLGYRRENEDE